MDAILIAGPTASGKSRLASELAIRHGGAVVNADSMQVYEGLHVLTARPTAEETAAVEHRLYGHVSPAEHYSTGRWQADAQAVLDELKAQGRPAVFVGGTGLYFEALLGGLSVMPAIPDDIRERWRARLASEGAGELHRLLAERDRQMAERLKSADGQRIVRALEVLEATGRSIATFQDAAGKPVLDASKVRKIVLMPERGELRNRIDQRFDVMMDQGALDEARRLRDRHLDPLLPAMKAIGVRQLIAHLDGETTIAHAVERAKAASRQYAKRQSTWFRNRLGPGWEVFPGNVAASETFANLNPKKTKSV